MRLATGGGGLAGEEECLAGQWQVARFPAGLLAVARHGGWGSTGRGRRRGRVGAGTGRVREWANLHLGLV